MVKNNENKILFIKRKSVWDLPKGKLEKGEEIEECAIREVEEECGISNVKLIKDLIKTYHTYDLKGQMILKETVWYEMFYDGNEKLIPQIKEEISEAHWFNHNMFREIRENTYGSIIDILDAIEK